MAELTQQGFVARTLEQIISEISGNLKATFGTSFDTSPESPDGQLIGIFAEQIYNAELAAQASYQSSDADLAVASQLEYVCDYNGVYRQLETPTVVYVQFSGTPNTVMPKGSIVSTEDGLDFTLDADTQQGILGSATCTKAGAYHVQVGEICKIQTPVAGISSVTNPSNGAVGKDRESDGQLRNRRAFSVINKGVNTVESLYATLYKVGAEYISIVNNTTDKPMDGVPPNNYQVIVSGLSDQEVAEAIFDNAPAGVPLFGKVAYKVYDSKEVEHVIRFDRPVSVPVDVQVEYKALYGTSKDTASLIKEAVEAYINSLEIGVNVIWSDAFGAAVLGSHVHATNSSVLPCKIKKSSESVWKMEDIRIAPAEKAVVGTVTVTEVL